MRLLILSAFALLAACDNASDLPEPTTGTEASEPSAETEAPDMPDVDAEPAPANDDVTVMEDPMEDIIVGGPCSYETTIVEASAVEVDEDGALMEGPDGEFYVPAEYLGELPSVGETLTLQRESIVEGTCTPEIYTVID